MMATALYIAIIVSLTVAIYRAPGVAVAAVLCMFGLEQWAQSMIPFFTYNHTLTNLISGSLVVFGFALVCYRQGAISLNYSTVGWLVLVLYFYAFTSVSYTHLTLPTIYSV